MITTSHSIRKFEKHSLCLDTFHLLTGLAFCESYTLCCIVFGKSLDKQLQVLRTHQC